MADTRILVGLLAILIAVSGVVYIGIGERDRQVEYAGQYHARSVQNGAAMFEEYCSTCHGIRGEGIEGVAPALNSQYFFEQRLTDIGYQGSLRAYVTLTVRGGRPVMSAEGPYPQNMPTWSVDYGGPLRNDQIDDIVNYVMSWSEEAAAAAEPGSTPTPVPGDTPEERGLNLFQGMGCVGCHAVAGKGGAVGPELTNVYSKGEDYVHQSIVQPNAVIVEGFQPNIMPQNFDQRLSEENISDIIAYLQSVAE
jgi:cytochrome c oxidase subunit 2